MNVCEKCGTEYDGAERFCPKDGTRLGGTAEGPAIRISSRPPAADPLIGSIVQKRYKVLGQIGEGGMGVVYIAEHVEIEKKVALKVLRDDFSKRPEVVARFRQEARSASKIGNAHIVDVTDFGQLSNGGVYFVMEYLQGIGLSDLVRRTPLPLQRAVPIIRQIARALQAAHKLGIVHRDLKPENIFLVDRDEQKDFVKVLDFGIAKISDRDSDGKRLTKTGMIFGTPEYMSPEQASGKELDHRVDVYALGCIMFEMFTGQVPFEGESFMGILTQHMFEPVPNIEVLNPDTDVPPSVRAVVYKAMAKESDQRYSDMDALEQDLGRAMNDSGYVVDYPQMDDDLRVTVERPAVSLSRGLGTALDWTPNSGDYPGQKKNRRGIIVGIVLALLLLVGGVIGLLKGLSGGRENDTANIGGSPSPVQSAAISVAPSPEQKAPLVEVKKRDASPEKAKTESPEGVKEPEKKPKKTLVSIQTKPTGARIFIDGLGQVCSKTPCEVELAKGRPAQIEARRGKRISKITFTPSRQNKDLTLELKKPSRKAPRGGGNPPRPRPESVKPGTKTGDNGLKIPGIFKDQ